jgi:galactokinase
MLERLPPPLDARARHVFEENARVDAAVDALARGDLPELGRLLERSHASLRDLYEVSVPEVNATVARALDAGAAGARMMGGGFGGQVLALMPPGTPAPAGALEVRPGAGARVLER